MKRELTLAAVAASAAVVLTVAGSWGSVAAAAGAVMPAFAASDDGHANDDSPRAPWPGATAARIASYVEQGPNGARTVMISFDRNGTITDTRDLPVAAHD